MKVFSFPVVCGSCGGTFEVHLETPGEPDRSGQYVSMPALVTYQHACPPVLVPPAEKEA